MAQEKGQMVGNAVLQILMSNWITMWSLTSDIVVRDHVVGDGLQRVSARVEKNSRWTAGQK